MSASDSAPSSAAGPVPSNASAVAPVPALDIGVTTVAAATTACLAGGSTVDVDGGIQTHDESVDKAKQAAVSYTRLRSMGRNPEKQHVVKFQATAPLQQGDSDSCVLMPPSPPGGDDNCLSDRPPFRQEVVALVSTWPCPSSPVLVAATPAITPAVASALFPVHPPPLRPPSPPPPPPSRLRCPIASLLVQLRFWPRTCPCAASHGTLT